jgi:hypothetical protein
MKIRHASALTQTIWSIPTGARPKKGSRMHRLCTMLRFGTRVQIEIGKGKKGGGVIGATIVEGALRCDCCRAFFNPSAFEAHAVARPHKEPFATIRLERTGESLAQAEARLVPPQVSVSGKSKLKTKSQSQSQSQSSLAGAALAAADVGGDGGGGKGLDPLQVLFAASEVARHIDFAVAHINHIESVNARLLAANNYLHAKNETLLQLASRLHQEKEKAEQK